MSAERERDQSIEDWVAAVGRVLSHAKRSRQYGRIVIELFDGEVRRMEVLRSSVDPHSVDPDDIAPGKVGP